MKCLVTGATGKIGSLVTERLVDAGVAVAVLVRDRAKARSMFGGAVEVRAGDMTVTDGVRRILRRDPLSFEQWVAENTSAFVSAGPRRGKRAPHERQPPSRSRAR